MPATPIFALPYPAPSDPADVPLDMQELAERLEIVLPRELAYGELTAQFNVSATTAAAAQQAIVLPAFTLDGSTRIKLECYAPSATPGNVTGSTLWATLWDAVGGGAAAAVGVLVYHQSPQAIAAFQQAIYGQRLYTPGSGSHVYSLRFHLTSGGTGAAVFAGTGIAGASMPAFLRATRA